MSSRNRSGQHFRGRIRRGGPVANPASGLLVSAGESADARTAEVRERLLPTAERCAALSAGMAWASGRHTSSGKAIRSGGPSGATRTCVENHSVPLGDARGRRWSTQAVSIGLRQAHRSYRQPPAEAMRRTSGCAPSSRDERPGAEQLPRSRAAVLTQRSRNRRGPALRRRCPPKACLELREQPSKERRAKGQSFGRSLRRSRPMAPPVARGSRPRLVAANQSDPPARQVRTDQGKARIQAAEQAQLIFVQPLDCRVRMTEGTRDDHGPQVFVELLCRGSARQELRYDPVSVFDVAAGRRRARQHGDLLRWLRIIHSAARGGRGCPFRWSSPPS